MGLTRLQLARQVITVLTDLRDSFLFVFVLATALGGTLTLAGYIWDARWCFAISMLCDGIALSFGVLYFIFRSALKR